MLVQDAGALSALCEQIARSERVALDTEFHGERHYHPRLMLVQVLPDGGTAALVDPLRVDLAPLGEALSGRTLLVHGGQADVQILSREAGLRPGRILDTQVAAGLDGCPFPARLQQLTEHYLGRRLPKAETLSDWSRRPLTEAQETYALDDVRVLPALWAAIETGLRRRGHDAILDAVTAEVHARAMPLPDDQAWRGLSSAHRLQDEERSAARHLAEWREQTARQRDVQRGQVLSDGFLLDLARRRPVTLEAMRAYRRMPRELVNRDGAAVLAVLERARHATAPPPVVRDLRVELARAAAQAAEPTSGIAAHLIIPDDPRAVPDMSTIREGWRGTGLPPDFAEFLSGRSALCIDGSFVPVPR
jgi:ribonuclease D